MPVPRIALVVGRIVGAETVDNAQWAPLEDVNVPCMSGKNQSYEKLGICTRERRETL